MSVGTTLSRITGYLRLSAQTAALGVSALGNTYATANTTPNIIYELVLGGILTSVFVPVFVEWLQKHGREEAWLVADRVLTLTLVVLAAVAIVGAIFAPQIIRLYLSASDAADKEAQIALGTFFLRWFMPQIVFYGIGAVATGLLQAERKFAAPMFAPILNNLSVIATFGIYAWLVGSGTSSVEHITFAEKTVLAAGTTFGVAAMTLALWPSLRRLGFRWHLRFDWNHPAVRRLGKLALWVVVYVVANQLAYVVIIVFTRKVPPERVPDLLERVHPVPAAPLDRGGVHLHRAPPAHVEPMGRRRRRRAANVLLARDPRHDRGDRSGGARLHRARGADHAPAAAARASAARRTWKTSHTRCRRSRWVCRSSRCSNCSRGPSTRCRTRGPPRS